MPQISVIIPVYNTGTLLRETVNSVLEQSFSDFELILVDDGSNDETKQIISSFDDTRIKVIRKENGGVASARNTGILAAEGDHVALLDHDDLWHKDKLKVQKALLDADEDAVLVYSPIESFGTSDTIQIPEYDIIEGNAFLSELEQNKIHSTSCVMFRRSTVLVNDIRFVSETVPCDDWYFYLQISRYGKFLHSPDVPVYYRLHGGNLSSNVERMYRAGIAVLLKTEMELEQISKRIDIPSETLSGVLNHHLAKHFRGLAYLAVKQRNFSAASNYLCDELHVAFSLKAAVMMSVFSVLKFFSR